MEEAMMAASHRERTRALFKKGQKCIIPIVETDKESGEDKMKYYEAMVMRGEKRSRPGTNDAFYAYLIHYKGYGKQHDAWLEEKDLVKYDHDLLTGVESVTADALRRQAQDAAAAAKKETELQEIPSQLRLRMPPLLKKVALDDHTQVTLHGRVLLLPRSAHGRPSVADILLEWRQAAKEKAESSDNIDEIEAGLLAYFDNALRQFLLYHPEVQLCDEAMANGKAPSELYGAEHLVRLLVKLPELLPVAMMAGQGNARNIVTVEQHLHDIMARLLEGQAKYLSSAGEYQLNPHWTPPPSALLPVVEAAALAGSAPAAAPRAVAAQ